MRLGIRHNVDTSASNKNPPPSLLPSPALYGESTAVLRCKFFLFWHSSDVENPGFSVLVLGGRITPVKKSGRE
ncbi:hypothetical protein QE152_g40065 [Popillia japonica]|uniref:Uncharacterized protein n=1 Tax=Popillia japonica TaxID=7064 RepID=A0AAW1HSK8_POPJA